MLSPDLLIGKRPIQGGMMSAVHMKCPFQLTLSRRPIILQLNIEGFTANKMTVLQHLAKELEALVIALRRPTVQPRKGES